MPFKRALVICATAIGTVLFGVCFAIVVMGIHNETRDARGVFVAIANLKQISCLMLEYNREHGHLPPAHLLGADGKPAHSWRVLLLEWIDPALFKQYRFDEPWNGPNNRKLADSMPQIYRSRNAPNAGESTRTSYVVLVGPKTAFPGHKTVKLEEITNGLGQTILVAEAEGFNIHWMEPRDWDVEAFGIQISDVNDPGFSSYEPQRPMYSSREHHCLSFGSIGRPLEKLRVMSTIARGEKVDLKLVEAK